MFKRIKEYIKTKGLSPSVYIEGQEYSNSELLYKLDRINEFSLYTITKNEHRIDLISTDIYGDSKYSWVLMYLNRINLDELVRGVVIKYPPLNDLNNILTSI